MNNILSCPAHIVQAMDDGSSRKVVDMSKMTPQQREAYKAKTVVKPKLIVVA